MKIATWNVERLKRKKSLDEILSICNGLKADILVLTETDSRLRPDYSFCFQTPTPYEIQPRLYRPSENRVSIYTNYRCLGQYSTYDGYTALCTELETERGRLLVYGTIMGIYGNRHPLFKEDLSRQIEDIERLSKRAAAVCICGDFNCSFADNHYFTKFGRSSLLKLFGRRKISLLTGDQGECIDHIAISEGFVKGANIKTEEWNINKRLSDHKGISVALL